MAKSVVLTQGFQCLRFDLADKSQGETWEIKTPCGCTKMAQGTPVGRGLRYLGRNDITDGPSETSECHIQRYLPAHPGTSLLWGPDATNWRGILWLPPREENKFFVNTWLFFFTPFQMECINSFQQAYQLQSPKPVSTFRKFLSKILGCFYFIDSAFLLHQRSLVLYLAVPNLFGTRERFHGRQFFHWLVGD